MAKVGCVINVTRLGDLLDFGRFIGLGDLLDFWQVFKAFGNN